MFSIVWKLIILYLCESNIEFYMRVKEIPILLLTGYLGSGKTTLVNHILSNKRGIKFAVIVNDIGEVNIDADLIQRGGIVGKKDESLVALQNGCICCTLKMDLVEQIDDIMKQERFDYIVIEASGVCEPAPIAQTICSISSMGNTYGGCRLDCIVTVVDALRLQSEFSCGGFQRGAKPPFGTRLCEAKCSVLYLLAWLTGETGCGAFCAPFAPVGKQADFL